MDTCVVIEREKMRRFGSIAHFLAACLITVLTLQDVSGLEAEVRDISAEKYYEALHQAFKRAESSIYVAMFEIRIYSDRLSGPQYILLKDLIDAHKRGVKVRVYLDRSEDHDDATGLVSVHDVNGVAYDFLRKAGVDVRYAAPTRRLHAKLVVIDERIVVDGSTNWSYSALTKNAESATMITSQQYALQKLQWMAKLRESNADDRSDRDRSREVSKGKGP